MKQNQPSGSTGAFLKLRVAGNRGGCQGIWGNMGVRWGEHGVAFWNFYIYMFLEVQDEKSSLGSYIYLDKFVMGYIYVIKYVFLSKS